jgi:hypothetical protein
MLSSGQVVQKMPRTFFKKIPKFAFLLEKSSTGMLATGINK